MEDNPFEDIHSPQSYALYKKGEEIRKIAWQIADIIPEEGPLEDVKRFLIEDASVLSVKVSGAEGADLYHLRMESAVIIRKTARDLQTHCWALKEHGFNEDDYLNLLRNEIEEYRLLFIEWVNTFDRFNDVEDDWGLF